MSWNRFPTDWKIEFSLPLYPICLFRFVNITIKCNQNQNANIVLTLSLQLFIHRILVDTKSSPYNINSMEM